MFQDSRVTFTYYTKNNCDNNNNYYYYYYYIYNTLNERLNYIMYIINVYNKHFQIKFTEKKLTDIQ